MAKVGICFAREFANGDILYCKKKVLAWINRGGFDSAAAAARRDTTRFTFVTMNCHSLADRDCLADSQGWLSTRMNTFLLSGAK